MLISITFQLTLYSDQFKKDGNVFDSECLVSLLPRYSSCNLREFFESISIQAKKVDIRFQTDYTDAEKRL